MDIDGAGPVAEGKIVEKHIRWRARLSKRFLQLFKCRRYRLERVNLPTFARVQCHQARVPAKVRADIDACVARRNETRHYCGQDGLEFADEENAFLHLARQIDDETTAVAHADGQRSGQVSAQAHRGLVEAIFAFSNRGIEGVEPNQPKEDFLDLLPHRSA